MHILYHYSQIWWERRERESGTNILFIYIYIYIYKQLYIYNQHIAACVLICCTIIAIHILYTSYLYICVLYEPVQKVIRCTYIQIYVYIVRVHISSIALLCACHVWCACGACARLESLVYYVHRTVDEGREHVYIHVLCTSTMYDTCTPV